MGFRVQTMEHEAEHHSESQEIRFHYHSLSEFDSIEFFEDEAFVTVAYRTYPRWL